MNFSKEKETVLNPLGRMPEVVLHPLSPRLNHLASKVIYVVNSWREGSGMEDVLSKIADGLITKYPSLRIIQVDKPSPFLSNDDELWDEICNKADAFIYAAAPSCSTTAWAVVWSANLEKRSLPGIVLVFDTLMKDAEVAAQRQGVAMRILPIPYPTESIDKKKWDQLIERTDLLLTEPLASREIKTGSWRPPPPEPVAFNGNPDEVQDYFYDKGWTDGLPIVLPTAERVAAMLKGTSHPADEIITSTMWPEAWEVTVENVAVNGVMAGCRPEYLPVLLAAVDAFSKEDISAMVRSTNSFCFMQVVNGPIRNEIGMNAGTSALSPGNRANSTIGRALRLFVVNLGGGQIGVNLMANLGNVGLYSFCIPENEEKCPWEPLSVHFGFKRGDSAITIFSGGWFHAGNFISQPIEDLARTMAKVEHPTGMVALIAPPRAKLLAEKGLSREGVNEKLWRNATATIAEFKSDPWYKVFIEPALEGKILDGWSEYWPREFLTMDDDEIVPVFPRRNVHSIVVGGDASPMMQGWHMERPVFASIDKWR